MSNWKQYMAENDAYAESLAQKPHSVFPVDPYVLVFENERHSNVKHFYFDAHRKGASAWVHLIEGEDRALLIDTAFGIGDLRGLVREMTDKPLDVVATHFHGDHSLGNGQFERVHCHKFDAPYLRGQFAPDAKRMLPTGDFYRQEDVVPLGGYELVEVEAEHRFALGPGHTVEVIHMPGHAAGGIMLLDNSTGMLFSGDAVLSTPTLVLSRFAAPYYSEYLTVNAFHDALQAFLPRMGEVSGLYPGHGILGTEPGILKDMLNCCESILANPDDFEHYDYVSDPDQDRIQCVGRAMVVYSPDRVFVS